MKPAERAPACLLARLTARDAREKERVRGAREAERESSVEVRNKYFTKWAVPFRSR